MARKWHELRVREKVGPDKWVKKSKFYLVKRPGDAVAIYASNCSVEYTVMWCEKDRRHSPDRFSSQARKLMDDIRREQEAAKTTPSQDINAFSEFAALGSELLGDLQNLKSPKRKRGYNGSSEQTEKATAHD